MDKTRAYLDHNATAPVRPDVAAAVARALTLPGNPSSIHAEGRAARAALEGARAQVAGLVGAKPGQVVFTSGGTEAANAILSGPCAAGAGRRRPAFSTARASTPASPPATASRTRRWSFCRWMRRG